MVTALPEAIANPCRGIHILDAPAIRGTALSARLLGNSQT
jgi:hypothetical protein